MALLMDATFIASGANIVLLSGLLYPSFRNLVRTKSVVTIGLVFFVGMFLVQNAMTIYFHLTMMPFYNTGTQFFALFLAILQTGGFGFLLWVSYR